MYLVYLMRTSKRIPILLELFFLGIYGFVMLVFLFPNILPIIEDLLGIQSAINFILYLSIFISYLLLFLLYKKLEDRREDITKLTREIAYLKHNYRKKNDNVKSNRK